MAKITGPRKLYRYTDDFKLKAVKLTELQGAQIGTLYVNHASRYYGA